MVTLEPRYHTGDGAEQLAATGTYRHARTGKDGGTLMGVQPRYV